MIYLLAHYTSIQAALHFLEEEADFPYLLFLLKLGSHKNCFSSLPLLSLERGIWRMKWVLSEKGIERRMNFIWLPQALANASWDSLWGQAKILILFIVKLWTCLHFIYAIFQIRKLPKHTEPHSHMSSAESDQTLGSIRYPTHGATINAGDGCQHTVMHCHYMRCSEGSHCT